MIVTSNAPPGSVHGAEKDRTALCDVASTGAECNRPATPTTATATANNANAFLIKLAPYSLPLSLLQPSDQQAKQRWMTSSVSSLLMARAK